MCVKRGDVEGVTELLDMGCDVNGSDYDGRSALHLAASEGKVDVVRLLLAWGAKVNALDRWGSTVRERLFAVTDCFDLRSV